MNAPYVATTTHQARHVKRRTDDTGVRDVRVVHSLDGIETAVHPRELTAVGEELWQRCHHSGFGAPTMILGLDAGGIIPAVAVSLASGLPYRLAWKLDLDLPDQHVFEEPHARRTRVCIYGPLDGERVLIVDDEITTGQTATNLITVLQREGSTVIGVACLVEDTSGDSRRLLSQQGVPLCALTTL